MKRHPSFKNIRYRYWHLHREYKIRQVAIEKKRLLENKYNIKTIIRLLETIEVIQNRQVKTLDKLEKNLDFLKAQELEIDRKVQYLNTKFNLEKIPTKIEIEKLVKTIVEKPKELEIKNTQVVTNIIQQVEKVIIEISNLKEIITRLEQISLS